MSARWGDKLSRQSMCDWVEVAALWLEPVYRHLHRQLVSGDYLQADETPVRCNDPDHERGGTRQCYLWVISRPGGAVVFSFREPRAHDELGSLLGPFRGVLQSDQYGAYASHERRTEGITRVGCWAHARRKFNEAIDEAPKAAQLVLRLISRLYRLEREWDEAAVGARRAELRREHFARPLRWLRYVAIRLGQRVLPQSQLGKAVGYLLNHWEVLVAHQQYACTRLDNNLVENAILPSAIGKKNWLFVGHPGAGQRSAILYSLLVSCQIHGKDPLAYLRDLLNRLSRLTDQGDLAPLTQARWQRSGAAQLCLNGHNCDSAMMTIAAAPALSAMPLSLAAGRKLTIFSSSNCVARLDPRWLLFPACDYPHRNTHRRHRLHRRRRQPGTAPAQRAPFGAAPAGLRPLASDRP